MPDYQGSIQLADGSGESLPTRLIVEEERLIVAAGDTEIGNWALEELSAERKDGNFHIAVEGEELVLTVADPVGFMEALGIDARPVKVGKSRKKKRRRQEQSPLAEPPTSPVSIPATPVGSSIEDAPVAQPSWWSRVPLRAKLVGGGVLALAVLGVLLPDILALLLLLAGMVTLFLGIAARSEGGTTLLPPPFFATTASAVVGIALVLLGVVIIAVT